MSIVLLTEWDRNAISAAVERQRAKPVPWEELRERAVDDPSPYLRLEDRKTDKPRRPGDVIELSFGYRLNISFEVQPVGLCQHISLSSPDPARTVPGPVVIEMVVRACGMDWPLGSHSRIWFEDFMVDGMLVGKAVNVLQVVELSQQACR